MNPGRRLFLTSNENVKSGFIVPIIGNTIYRGNTEIIATKNPFAKFDSSPRNKHSFWGLTTIERTIKIESAISRSRIEELSTVWLGISRSDAPYILPCKIDNKRGNHSKNSFRNLGIQCCHLIIFGLFQVAKLKKSHKCDVVI